MNTRTFGKKGEKLQIDEDQLNFFSEILNEAESLIDGQLSIEPSMDEVVVPAHKRLPDEVYKKLELIPAVFEVHEHHIAVYKGKNGKDVNISRQTMANWVITSAEWYISLVHEHMKEELLNSPVIHADETPVMVTKDGRKGMHKNCMWVYRSGSMCKANQAVLYDYQKTRKDDAAHEFLSEFDGKLVCDGYQVYHTLENREDTNFKVRAIYRLRYVFSLIQQKNDNLFFHFKDGYRLSLLKTPQTSLKMISPKPLKKL